MGSDPIIPEYDCVGLPLNSELGVMGFGNGVIQEVKEII